MSCISCYGLSSLFLFPPSYFHPTMRTRFHSRRCSHSYSYPYTCLVPYFHWCFYCPLFLFLFLLILCVMFLPPLSWCLYHPHHLSLPAKRIHQEISFCSFHLFLGTTSVPWQYFTPPLRFIPTVFTTASQMTRRMEWIVFSRECSVWFTRTAAAVVSSLVKLSLLPFMSVRDVTTKEERKERKRCVCLANIHPIRVRWWTR